MRRVLCGLSVLTALVMAACGSSSVKSSSSPSVRPVPSGVSGSLAGASFCDKAKSYTKVAVDQFQQLFSSPSQSNPQDFSRKFDALIKQVDPLTHDLSDSAPSEIKADVNYLAASTDKVVQVLDRNNGDFTAAGAQLTPLVSDPHFTASTQRLTTYLSRKCGIALPSAGPTPSLPSGLTP